MVKPDNDEWLGARVAQARLAPLDAAAEPNKYNLLKQWCAQDAVLAAYQQGWSEQKRLPVAGEFIRIKGWVEDAEARQKHDQMVKQVVAAQAALTGVIHA